MLDTYFDTYFICYQPKYLSNTAVITIQHKIVLFFSLQLIAYCVAATTCSGQGTCGADGLCQCDAGLTGADCTEGISRRGICGSFFLSLLFSRSQVIMKKSSNDTFFRSK